MKVVVNAMLIVAGVGVLILAAGYFAQARWAVSSWPWPDGRLTYIFVASILAAIGAALLWIGISNEWGHLSAGSLNLLVTTGGISAFLFYLIWRAGQTQLYVYALAGAIAVVGNGLIFLGARRLKTPEMVPLPRLVRFSYTLFTTILILVGGALILGRPNVMPWPLKPETSVLIGFIFLGDAFYFLYAVLRPYWQYGRAQLWSFLVYDLVLIGPLIGHLNTVLPEHRTSLLVYIAILVYSGALAAFYLFIHGPTRVWAPGYDALSR